MALNFDAITATTYKKYRRTMADNVMKKIALLAFLRKKGKIERKGGGTHIVEPLMYGLNSTFNTYSGYDVLDATPQDGMTAAQFNWKNASVGITISKEELDQNKSEEKIIDLMKSKVQQAEKTFQLRMNEMLFGDGTGNGDKNFDGLGNLVSTSPSTDATTGGITGVTYDWWRNVTKTTANFSLTGLADMRNTYNTCSREGDQPEILICDQTTFEAYEGLLTPMERINFSKNSALAGDAGFDTLAFKGKPIVWDYHCTSQTILYLNCDYLRLIVDPDTDFDMTEWRVPVNQMAKTAYILLRGNMTMNNRQLQGRQTITAYS